MLKDLEVKLPRKKMHFVHIHHLQRLQRLQRVSVALTLGKMCYLPAYLHALMAAEEWEAGERSKSQRVSHCCLRAAEETAWSMNGGDQFFDSPRSHFLCLTNSDTADGRSESLH